VLTLGTVQDGVAFDAILEAIKNWQNVTIESRPRTVVRAGGVLLFTADHGNCEIMRDPETGEPHTAHTLSPVPVVLVNGPEDVIGLHDGRLADVAPTLLELLRLPQPEAMTGRSLIDRETARRAAE